MTLCLTSEIEDSIEGLNICLKRLLFEYTLEPHYNTVLGSIV